jgi:hypothetical protein
VFDASVFSIVGGWACAGEEKAEEKKKKEDQKKLAPERREGRPQSYCDAMQAWACEVE